MGQVFGLSSDIKQPSFKVERADGDFEVRTYEDTSYVVAKTATKSGAGSAINSQFRTLANYIFGGNAKKEQIAMTTPVTMWKEADADVMIFFMLDQGRKGGHTVAKDASNNMIRIKQ